MKSRWKRSWPSCWAWKPNNEKSSEIICFFFILLLLPLTAGAFPLDTPVTDSISIQENLKILWDKTANNPDLEFWGIINRLTLDVIKGPVLVGLRYDVDLAIETGETNALYRPRKYFLQIRQRNVNLYFGDFYSSMGRGLLLNVVKNDEFGEDTSIQGELFSVNTDYFSFRGLGGAINPGDPIRFTPEQAKEEDIPYEDRDVLWGGEISTSWPGVVTASGRYIGAIIRTDEVAEVAEFECDNFHNLYGVSLEFPDIFGVASFYAEYAWLDLIDGRRGGLEDRYDEGRALYFAFNAFFGGFDFLLEGKDYYKAEFKYAEGANLEYQKVVFDLTKYEDEIGLRSRAGYHLPVVDLYIYLNYLHTKTHELMPKDLKGHYDQGNEYDWADGVQHLFGGLEKDFANSAFFDVNVGYRQDHLGRWNHAELYAGSPFLPRHSVEGAVQWREYQGIGIFETAHHGSELFSLSYAWSPYLNVTTQYEHSNEPQAGSTGESEFGGAGDTKENFYSIEMLVKPKQDVSLRLFWGSVKGGLTCAGGVCRMVPSFEGFKADLALKF